MITLSEEQEIVHDSLIKWFMNYKKDYRKTGEIKYTTITGFAGTGKTTLISKLKDSLIGMGIRNIAFCSFMGKAASVLANKINYDPDKDFNLFVGTLHRLMYEPKFRLNHETGKREICGWQKKSTNEIEDYDLIIVDESSTIYYELFNDVTSYRVPVMFFGDNGQLPPISEESFNLLKNPDYTLTQIHRQALDNPIISLSKFIREKGYIPEGMYSKGVFKIPYNNPKCKEILENFESNEDSIMLCSFNKTRCQMNKKMRTKMGFTQDEPYPTDRVICLRNNHNAKIMNGMLGTVAWVAHPMNEIYDLTIQMDGIEGFYSNYVFHNTFGKEQYDIDNYNYKDLTKKLFKKTNDLDKIDFFDFGYCITTHKSQGSEWNKGIIIEERTSRWDDSFYKKLLYTAVTRFKEKLMVCYR